MVVKYGNFAGSANGRHPRSERGNLGPNPSPAAPKMLLNLGGIFGFVGTHEPILVRYDGELFKQSI